MRTILLDVVDEPRLTGGSTGPWLLGLSIAALIGLVILFIYRKRKQKSS